MKSSFEFSTWTRSECFNNDLYCTYRQFPIWMWTIFGADSPDEWCSMRHNCTNHCQWVCSAFLRANRRQFVGHDGCNWWMHLNWIAKGKREKLWVKKHSQKSNQIGTKSISVHEYSIKCEAEINWILLLKMLSKYFRHQFCRRNRPMSTNRCASRRTASHDDVAAGISMLSHHHRSDL